MFIAHDKIPLIQIIYMHNNLEKPGMRVLDINVAITSALIVSRIIYESLIPLKYLQLHIL